MHVLAHPARLTGFLGPNGAGKTTAIRAVFGLVELDEGVVRWNGTPMRGVRQPFGYMPEERGLLPRITSATSSCTSGGCAAVAARGTMATVDDWLARLGSPIGRMSGVDVLSHGYQQHGPADRGVGERPRAAGPRRTVLGSRPARGHAYG